MTAEQSPTPLRVARTAGERMVEVAAELDRLTRMLRDGDGGGAGWYAGAIAWRLLVVRGMVRASPAQALLAALHIDAVDAALAAAVQASGWGRTADLDEPLSDLMTVLADIADEVRPLPA